MGFRFRKSVSLGKGVKVNFSKSGPSLSVGGRGHSVTFSKSGTYANVGVPGTGVSYRGKIAGGKASSRRHAASGYVPSHDDMRYHTPTRVEWLSCLGIVIMVAILVIYIAVTIF